MKVRINRENYRRIISIGVAGIILVGGGIFLNNALKKKEETYPLLKEITTLDTNYTNELVYDGVTYQAPDGYGLEVVNGNVHAYKRFYLIEEPEKTKDEYGFDAYIVPDKYTLVDGLIYREILEYAEPIIVDSKNK